jgi:hypothetical protein
MVDSDFDVKIVEYILHVSIQEYHVQIGESGLKNGYYPRGAWMIYRKRADIQSVL